MTSKPTVVMITCFTGAPWQLDQLHHPLGWPTRTMRLPERLGDLAKLADFACVGHAFPQSTIPAIRGAQ